MSSGGLGSGGYYGGGPGGGSLLGGLFGPGGGMGGMGPRGPYGVWPSCGCSTLFIILAGILLVCGGLLRVFGQ